MRAMHRTTDPIVDYTPPGLLLDRLGRRASLFLAGALLLAIGLVDYASGYALHQSPLYLVPIAIAAWAGGARGGLVAALLVSPLWLAAFHAEHLSISYGAYLWETLGTLGGFAIVVWLIAHMRQALSQADERFVRMLEGLRAAIYVVDEERQCLLYANPEMQRLDSRLAEIGPRAFEAQFVGESTAGHASQPAASGFTSGALRHTPSGRWYRLQEGSIPWGKWRAVKLKVLNDVTEQKNAQMLREQRRESV
ncbi:MAG: PAS domain-containing protein, partial [Betaproteobacteria bacterium]|nr:PAS domain-containing protein [Betaproteobacteria bacterium]